jgi:cobalt/nickel transport protein
MKTTTKCWVALGVLALLSPLGILLPNLFHSGSAWGEWNAGEIKQTVGYVPQGVAHAEESQKAPMNDYTFKGWSEKSPAHRGLAYACSALVGVTVIGLLTWLLGNFLSRKDK